MNQKTNKLVIIKQAPMIHVLYALTPLCLASVYFFGLRFIAVLGVSIIVGVICEHIFSKVYGQKVTTSVFVTAFLFALSMPPLIPLWIVGVGTAFGVIFGKMVFGGFGKNVFNPAISGRAFVYISFGIPLTGQFVEPVRGPLLGGFTRWFPGTDVVSSATPIATMTEGQITPLYELFLGMVPGSFGETGALLIIVGGLYIIYKKAAQWRIVVAGFLGFMLFTLILWAAGVSNTLPPLAALLSGSFLIGLFFMITDPVSAGQTTNLGRWVYGAMFGVLTVLIRVFSGWDEGVTFAILIANMFAPLLDHVIKELNIKQKPKKA